MPLGRFDQYIEPFYRKDIESGRLTREKAQELLESFWLKLNLDSDYTHSGMESDTGQNITLGGVTPAGKDAVNEISYMCLNASRKIALSEPKIMVRMHKNSPPEFWNKCCQLAREGMGFPIFANDDVVIPAMEKAGYTLPDARDYSNGGCWEFIIPGRSNDRTHSGAVLDLKFHPAVLMGENGISNL